MKIYTIGFTKKSAREFFTRLKQSGVEKLVDIRLNNTSQLAGFAKRDDLAFFCETICNIPYQHLPEFAPTQEILDRYKKNKGDWEDFERDFLNLIAARQIERTNPALLQNACLLCSEHEPQHCHRRLVAEYLKSKWDNVQIAHL